MIVDARGERMIVNHLDPSLPVDAAWLPSAGSVGARVVLADTRWPEGALAALVAARDAGLPAVLDADRPVPPDGALLRAATHVAFSSDALADLTGIGDARPALAEVARGLQGWCCVTAGGDGVYSYEQGEMRHDPGIRRAGRRHAGSRRRVARRIRPRARRGARARPTAVRFASAAAALKVQRSGGRAGAPTRAELDLFLATRPAA